MAHKRKKKRTSRNKQPNTAIGCADCTGCTNHKTCAPFRGKLPPYDGVRYTADSFDCALPVAIDFYNTCSYRCLYCFSNYLMRDPHRTAKSGAGAMRLTQLEALLAGTGKMGRFTETLLKESGAPGRRMPVQWGALGDPFCNIEAQQGYALQAIPLFEKYNQPVRVSTKGARVLLNPRYQTAFTKPHLWWFAFSLISADDRLLRKIDKDAPSTKARIAAMRSVVKMGATASLRFRPIIPGVSDSTKRHPKAWRDLLRMAADAGASAVSMEFVFVPGAMPTHVKKMWDEIEFVSGAPLQQWYKHTTSVHGACLRSSRAWKENLTFAIREETHKLGMAFAISDPHWKELNDYGCCCGIAPDHPTFGGWLRKNATNALVTARDAGKVVTADDGIPDWAYKTRLDELVCVSGPRNAYRRHKTTWADKLRNTWNDLKSPRGPVQYFGGVLWPVGRTPSGDVIYEYRKVPRTQEGHTQPLIKV